jgi:hypothetical protein
LRGAMSENKRHKRAASVSHGRRSLPVGLSFPKFLEPQIDRAAESLSSFRGCALTAGASLLGYRPSGGEHSSEPAAGLSFLSWISQWMRCVGQDAGKLPPPSGVERRDSMESELGSEFDSDDESLTFSRDVSPTTLRK